MRIIAGREKGRLLSGPRSQRVRPVLAKVKEAIFNILGNIDGLHLLDLFAGTGSVGLEAISRGVSNAVFIDSEVESILTINENLKRCRFHGTVLKLRLPQGLTRLPSRFKPFDLIFVDPPYDRNLVRPTLRRILREKLLAAEGRIIIEHSPREPIEEESGLSLVDQRKYGQTVVSFVMNRDKR